MKAAEYLPKTALVLCVLVQFFLIQRIERQRDEAIKVAHAFEREAVKAQNIAEEAQAIARRAIAAGEAIYERTH